MHLYAEFEPLCEITKCLKEANCLILALIEVEILLFFSFKIKRLGRMAGTTFKKHPSIYSKKKSSWRKTNGS